MTPAEKKPILKKKSNNDLREGVPKSARSRFNPNPFLDMWVNYIMKYPAPLTQTEMGVGMRILRKPPHKA